MPAASSVSALASTWASIITVSLRSDPIPLEIFIFYKKKALVFNGMNPLAGVFSEWLN